MTRRHFLGSAAAAAVSGKPQDLIIVLCDDLGYGDLGCYGQTRLKTPNLGLYRVDLPRKHISVTQAVANTINLGKTFLKLPDLHVNNPDFRRKDSSRSRTYGA